MRDLNKFSLIQLDDAARLLLAFKTNRDVTELFRGSGVYLDLDESTGNVFLVDDELNYAGMNDLNKLEDWVFDHNFDHSLFLSELRGG